MKREEAWFKNAPGANRENSPASLLVLGNAPGGRSSMAKRKGGSSRKGGRKNDPGRASGRKGGSSRKGGHNAPMMVSARGGTGMTVAGVFRLPTMGQAVGAGGTAIILPAVSRVVGNFMPMLGTGYVGVGVEAVLGSLASGLTRKQWPGTSEGILLFTVGRAIGRLGYLVSKGFVGFADDAENPGLHAYIDSTMSAYVKGVGAAGDEQLALSGPTDETQMAPVMSGAFERVI